MQHGLVHVSCPCCGADDAAPWGAENGYTAGKCRVCGLVYVNPRPGDEVINEANKVGVHKGDEEALVVTTRRRPGKVRYYAPIVADFFSADFAVPIRWLDVGAGYGEVIEAVTQSAQEGSYILGIEPMAPKVAVARRLGLPVDARPLDEVGADFDVISLINVYSHIPNFREFGRALVEKLKPGGSLFIETGNGGALDNRMHYPDQLFLPDHLVFSGPLQMKRIFADLGLTLERCDERPVDGLAWSAKVTIRNLLKGRLAAHFPGTSPFRTVFYRARKPV